MKTEEILGGHAVVREPSDMRGRDRNLVRAAAMSALPILAKLPKEATDGKIEGESDEDFAERLGAVSAGMSLTLQEGMLLQEMREATVIAALVSWTRPEPLPTLATIGDLEADLYDALIEKVAGVPAVLANAINFDVSPDADSPTPDSESLDGCLSAEAESTLTLTSPTDGESTAIESSIPA